LIREEREDDPEAQIYQLLREGKQVDSANISDVTRAEAIAATATASNASGKKRKRGENEAEIFVEICAHFSHDGVLPCLTDFVIRR
jgi:hypothetical protein